MNRLMHASFRMALGFGALLLIGAACGPIDRPAEQTGSLQGGGGSVESTPNEVSRDERRPSGGAHPGADDNGSLPPIIVEAPFEGQEVASPLLVSGTADVFEATVSMELLDESGDVIVEKFTTATCGTGCRGDYATRLRFEVDDSQPATLQVFESSAEDGRPLHTVAIPVVLVP